MANSISDDIAERVRRLPRPKQEQALAYIQSLESAAETSASPEALTQFAGSIATADLAEISAAIEADCERVDAADW
jgi:hypothetical protein